MISVYILPLIVLFIIIYALKKKIDIYNSFLLGAKDGLHLAINIIPAIIGMVFAVNIFLDSGILTRVLSIMPKLFIPTELFAMAILRPISGTATLAILSDIFAKYGADSFWGNLGSIIQGCTDTTVYVLALYFGSVRIAKTRYALKVGLFADAIGIILAFTLAFLLFS